MYLNKSLILHHNFWCLSIFSRFLFTFHKLISAIDCTHKGVTLQFLHYKRTKTIPGWSPRGNQRWLALFQRFHVCERCFREHEEHQRWSALLRSCSGLSFFLSQRCLELKNSGLVSAVSKRICFISALLSPDFPNFETLGVQDWTPLIYCETTLIFTHADENIQSQVMITHELVIKYGIPGN